MHDLVDNAECPGCRARSTLDLEPSYPTARVCGACRGWFLERDTAYRFFIEDLAHSSDDIARLLAAPGARRRRCPACDREMSAIAVRQEDVDLCGGCGGAWLPPGVMARLSGGARGVVAERQTVSSPFVSSPAVPPPNPFGPPSPRPASPFGPPGGAAVASPPARLPSSASVELELDLARPPPTASSPVVVQREPPRTLAAAAPSTPASSSVPPMSTASRKASSSKASRAAHRALTGATAVRRSRLPWIVAGAAVVVVATSAVVMLGGDDDDTPATAAPEDSTAKYAAYLRHYRFGGRHLDWWSARLTELSPAGAAPDAVTYALTKQRAERVGLVVTEAAGRVEVTHSEALAKELLERLEVR